MILTVLELIAMLAVLGLAFVWANVGIWQQEIWRDHEGDGFRIPTAHIPQH